MTSVYKLDVTISHSTITPAALGNLTSQWAVFAAQDHWRKNSVTLWQTRIPLENIKLYSHKNTHS